MSKTGNSGDWLSELKSRIDIVTVVSRYVPLEQKGRNHWGRCPFHHEKTPSFAVNPDRQAYKCFGCGAGGDAIKFVEEMESQDFMGAVRILAERVGFEIPDLSGKGEQQIAELKEKKQRLLAALKAAARFYYASWQSPKASAAKAYMKKREIPAAIAKNFGVGVSPGWDDLVQALTKQGFTREEMKDAGLIYEKNGKWYDSLANRLIFPIIDSYGNVVAFGGRQLEETGFAKYKNTSQTMIFDKSKMLYGINLVKKLKQEQSVDALVMVEGYMDTLSLVQAGFRNTVASMGTSLTKNQAQLAKRLADKVYISYDGDAAGQKATIRGLDILRDEGISVYVVELPEGLDPDDVIKKHGAEAYRKLLDAALPLTDYKLKLLRASFHVEVPEEKRKYALEALKVVAELSSSTEQEDYLKQVKSETGFTYESLRRDLDKLTRGENAEENEQMSERSASRGEDKAVRFLLYEMLLMKPFAYEDEDLSQFITGNVHRVVYEYARACKKKGEDVNINLLYDYVGEEGREELDRILSVSRENLGGRDEERYFKDCIQVFKSESLALQIDFLTRELETEQDAAKREAVARRIKESMLKMQQLK